MFDALPVDRVYLKTLDWNFRAQRCFEKSGFRRYGTSRRGEYVFILMDIRRESFDPSLDEQPPEETPSA
jgi:RimJ/RimL family protein N-acetyltransferase